MRAHMYPILCLFLLKGIFLTQGWNPVSDVSCIGRQILYH